MTIEQKLYQAPKGPIDARRTKKGGRSVTKRTY
jgi:hypothetical protein